MCIFRLENVYLEATLLKQLGFKTLHRLLYTQKEWDTKNQCILDHPNAHALAYVVSEHPTLHRISDCLPKSNLKCWFTLWQLGVLSEFFFSLFQSSFYFLIFISLDSLWINCSVLQNCLRVFLVFFWSRLPTQFSASLGGHVTAVSTVVSNLARRLEILWLA